MGKSYKRLKRVIKNVKKTIDCSRFILIANMRSMQNTSKTNNNTFGPLSLPPTNTKYVTLEEEQLKTPDSQTNEKPLFAFPSRSKPINQIIDISVVKRSEKNCMIITNLYVIRSIRGSKQNLCVATEAPLLAYPTKANSAN